MGVVVANSLRSENTDPVVPIILCTILGESFAESMMVSRMKGAHKCYHVTVHPFEWYRVDRHVHNEMNLNKTVIVFANKHICYSYLVAILRTDECSSNRQEHPSCFSGLYHRPLYAGHRAP